jgi:hypothetical protein
MNALAVDAVFTGPEKQVILLGEKDGCRVVMVSDPRFREADGSLFIDLRVHVRYGFSAGPRCLSPVSFDGYLTARQQPVLDPETWHLRFITVSSHLETRDRRPARLADFIWQRVQELVPGLLAPIVIDLGVPQKELGMFLEAVLPKDKPEQVLAVIQSLRPGPIEIRKTHLTFLQRMDIPETIYKTAAPAPPPVFSRNQKQAFIEAWEIWDAFMVHMITALAPRPLDDDEQDILLDLLLRVHSELEARVPCVSKTSQRNKDRLHSRVSGFFFSRRHPGGPGQARPAFGPGYQPAGPAPAGNASGGRQDATADLRPGYLSGTHQNPGN